MDPQTSLFTLLILTNLCLSVSGQLFQCSDNGTYTTNSTFFVNLNTLLSSLPSTMADNGFRNVSQGQDADRVYAVALCRGDIQLKDCRSCIQQATKDVMNLCPYRKGAVVWDILCMLRYSDVSFFGRRASSPPKVVKNVVANATSPDQFNKDLRILLEDVRSQAASGGGLMKVAAGDRKTVGEETTIYALLQCTPDMSTHDCGGCLTALVQTIPDCCLNSIGARIVVPSCTLNFEIFSFYNVSRIQEVEGKLSKLAPPVPSPTPPSEGRNPSPPRGNDSNSSARTIIIIVIAIILCLMIAVSFIWLSKRKKKTIERTLSSNNEINTVESVQYDFNKIREATNDFSDTNKLGEGGFGAVYKGILQNGQEIAVKWLFRSSQQGDSGFQNEIMLLTKLQHRNLVRLLGFAQEGIERVLVYEFVHNGSLDHCIFDQTGTHSINWNIRFKIIGGVARGLLYLHEDSRLRVIHRDLKASNILLDANMNSKIGDFGIAKLCTKDEGEANTRRIVGTYGYMPPEYIYHGRCSIKTDVFSFGVLVLEIISGQRNNNFRNDGITIEEGMLNFAWRNWHEGTVINVIDPILRSASDSYPEIIKCVHVALLCVQEKTYDRPTMASIGLMLHGSTTTLPMPSRPSFSVSRSSNNQPSHLSKNEASISELHPR